MSEQPDPARNIGVHERMILAGWLKETARADEVSSDDLTADGIVAIRLLRRFLALNGGKLNGMDMAMFFGVVADPSLILPEEPRP